MPTERKKRAGTKGGTVGAGRKGVSFVMTLWLEPTDSPGQPQWRWRVVDAQKNQQVYFSKLADVLAYVSEQAGVSPPC